MSFCPAAGRPGCAVYSNDRKTFKNRIYIPFCICLCRALRKWNWNSGCHAHRRAGHGKLICGEGAGPGCGELKRRRDAVPGTGGAESVPACAHFHGGSRRGIRCIGYGAGGCGKLL